MQIQPVFAQHPPWLKLILLMIIIFASLLLVTLFGMLIATPFFGKDFIENPGLSGDYTDPMTLFRLKYLQIVSQIGLFVVPVVIFVFAVTKEKAAYLSLRRPPWPSMLAGAAVMLLALPLINWLSQINMQLQLPASMSGIERWMQQSEAEAGRLTEAFILTSSTGSLLLNLLMIAIIPALGEEMLFRGIIMKLFREWTKNAHVAIILSAALFAFIHFQFYGFLPRFLMGVLFGYMLYWSGSLWVPILAHFVNNGTAVIVAWMSTRWFPATDFNTFGSSDNAWIIAGSGVFVALICFFLWLRRTKEVLITS